MTIFNSFSALITCVALCATTSTSVAQTIGKTVKADRTVSGSKSGVLSANSRIRANERISANSTGLGHFEFNDGTKMVVGPGTNLLLDETVFNPNGSTFRRFALNTSAGALRFISGASSSNSYQIKTPTGTIGVRGTAFDMHHYRGRTYILLVSGKVEICGNGGECQSISRKCDYVVAHPNGRVTPPTQPGDGIYGGRDMGRYFPFIADQSNILESFQLKVNTCGGGSGTGNIGGLGDGMDGPAIDFSGNDGGSDSDVSF